MTENQTPPRVVVARAGQAGALAAVAMLAVQLLWRLTWSPTGVQAFPESVLAAVARLTPLSVFGSTTENYGSLAKKTLFVAVLFGIVAVGSYAGGWAGRLAVRRRNDLAARLLAGGAVAAGLMLFTGLAVHPIAHLGPFGADTRNPGALQAPLIAGFVVFAVVWAILAEPMAVAARATEHGAVSRRRLIERGGSLAMLAAVVGATWRLLNPRVSRVAVESSRQSAQSIAATAAAGGGAAPTPTTAPGAGGPPTTAPLGDPPAQPGTVLEPGDPGEAGAIDPEAPATRFAQLEADAKLPPVLTSVADFYHVSKNISDPEVDGEGWSLKIGGLVERELELPYEELVARASTQNITTLCCISNTLNGDLIGTALWTGIPLAALLTEAGVKPGAVDLKFRCSDDYEDSIPVAQGMDPDTLVVVGMNGEPLRPDHGYPARMIVPAIYGMKNVKWLESIEVVDHDFKGYWQTRGWSDPAPYQIWGRVESPRHGAKLAPGPNVAAGVASAGDRGISRVEISLDDGETWADAMLEPALNAPFTWVRWVFPFDGVPDTEIELRLRATDGAGTVAPQDEQDPLPEGATGWPKRNFRIEEA